MHKALTEVLAGLSAKASSCGESSHRPRLRSNIRPLWPLRIVTMSLVRKRGVKAARRECLHLLWESYAAHHASRYPDGLARRSNHR